MTTVQEQLMDAAIAELRMNPQTAVEHFRPTGEVAEALEGGSMTVTKTQADKLTIYSNQDGTPSTVLVYMLSKKLQQKLPDGRPAFSLNPVPRVMGEMLCPLHERHPERAHYDAIGLAGKVCKKSNITTVFEVEMHMKRKHKQEWQTIERDRERREREEQMNFMRVQAEAMQRLAEQGQMTQKRGA